MESNLLCLSVSHTALDASSLDRQDTLAHLASSSCIVLYHRKNQIVVKNLREGIKEKINFF